MSFTTDFVNKYEGEVVGFPNDDDYPGQCLSLAKVYIQERYGIYPPASGCGSARCYWSLFPDPLGTVLKLVSNTIDVIPKEGWIAVWNATQSNEYGHIGIVLEGATQTGFRSFDSNWGSKTAQIVSHDYNNVAGFLAPKEEEMADMYKGFDLDNKESMRVAVDVLVRVQNGEFVDKPVHTKIVEELDSTKEELSKTKQELDKEIQEHKKTIVKLDEVKQDVRDLNEDLENCLNKPITPPTEDIPEFRQIGDTKLKINGLRGDVPNYAVHLE